jgi:hypothetical protein
MKKSLFLLLLILMYSLASANIIHVSDYGAVANDDIDDTEDIQAALAACSTSGATLNFSAGTYLVQGSGTGNPIFVMDGYHNLAIDGNGAILSCENWDIVFYAQNSSQISVSDITIHWERDLPFSYGTITAKGSGFIDVTLTSPQVARAGLKTEAILQYDPANMRPSDNGYDYYQTDLGSTHIVASNVMRCSTNFSLSIGDNVIIRHQVYNNNAFQFIKVNGVTLNNLLVYSGAGMGIVGYANTNVSITNFRITRYGTRWMSTCADGIHLASTRGTINIKSCDLEGMGDDGINIHGIYFKAQYVSGNSLCLRDAWTNSAPYWWDVPLTGDKLVIVDPVTMLKKGEATVVSSSSDAGDNCLLVNFNSVAAGISEGDFLYNEYTMAELTVTNTTVSRNRARGILIQTSNALISNCAFNRCSGTAILATATTGGYFIESSPPEHITIRGCDIYNCNYGAVSMNAPLMLYTNTSTNQYANPVINDIHINNNLFTTISNQPAIYIRSSREVYLDSNQYSNNSVQQVEYMFDDNEFCSVYVNRKAPTGASAFGGTPVLLPSLIEAEAFDEGGEGVGYHDVTVANLGGSDYRSGERVDLYDDGEGGYGINYIDCSEWLGYTVTVPQNALYNVIVRGSTDFDWATFHLEKDLNSLTPATVFPNTGGWSNYQNDTIESVFLAEGTYQIKFVWDNLAIVLDYLQFDFIAVATGTVENTSNNVLVYPNPFTDALNISISDKQIEQVKLLDIGSRTIVNRTSGHIHNLGSLPVGIYYLQIKTNAGNYNKRVIKLK